MCQGEQLMLKKHASASAANNEHHKLSPSSRSTSTTSSTSASSSFQHDDYDNFNEDTAVLLNKGEAQELAEEWEPIVSEVVLKSAPPPWHAVALMVSVAAVMVQLLPSWRELDQVATLQTFAHAEPWIGSTWNLAILRGVVALSIWSTTLHVLCGPGWTQITNWKPGSQLKGNTRITLKGIKTMFPFTSWSWNLLGVSYTLNALIAGCVATGREELIQNPLPHNGLLRIALIVWEIAAPCAILVSAVIRYGIWDMVLHGDGDTSNLKSFRNVMMHNFNSVFVMAEVSLLGGLPVRISEVSLAPLLGVTYVFFSWYMQHHWTDQEHGPQFIYYFLDTTMGKVTTISLLVLLCALLLFYVIFALARIGLDQMRFVLDPPSSSNKQLYNEDEHAPYSSVAMAGHVLFTVLMSSAVCRFRDYW